MGAICFATLFEAPYAEANTTPLKNLLRQSKELFRTKPLVQRFMVLRLLLLSLDLAFPFFVVHAATTHGTGGENLSLIIVCTSLAGILQRPIWGKRLDRSARASIVLAAFLAALASLILLGVEAFTWMKYPIVHGAAFILISLAVRGGLNARNMYLVEITSDADRPVVAATTTTFAGIAGLILGALLGGVAHFNDVVPVIGGLVVLQIAAGIYGRMMFPQSEPTVADTSTG